MKNIKLYVARRENDMKQKEVARKLAMHPQTYHKKESGKLDFSITEGKMLAKIFCCTLDELFGKEETK